MKNLNETRKRHSSSVNVCRVSEIGFYTFKVQKWPKYTSQIFSVGSRRSKKGFPTIQVLEIIFSSFVYLGNGRSCRNGTLTIGIVCINALNELENTSPRLFYL